MECILANSVCRNQEQLVVDAMLRRIYILPDSLTTMTSASLPLAAVSGLGFSPCLSFTVPELCYQLFVSSALLRLLNFGIALPLREAERATPEVGRV